MACLDTNFMISLLRKERAAKAKLKGLQDRGVALTTTPITASELFRGAYKASSPEREIRRVREVLGYFKLLDYSMAACELYGKIVNELRKKGTPIGDLDAIIAGIAITHGESLLTKDEHFKRIPSLIIESW